MQVNVKRKGQEDNKKKRKKRRKRNIKVKKNEKPTRHNCKEKEKRVKK